jgi:hypothetical protein
MAELASRLPHVRFDESLPEQLQQALEQDTSDAAYVDARKAIGVPGASLRLMQTSAYGLIGLDRPEWVPRVRAPKPTSLKPPPCTSHLVIVSRDESDSATLNVRRFGAAVEPELVHSNDASYRHLAVETTELDLSLRTTAEVLITRDDTDLKQLLARNENCCRVAARITSPDTCLVLTAATGLVELHVADPRVDPAVLPSVLRALMKGTDDPAAVLAQLKDGVPLRLGRIRTLMTGQDALPSSRA